jgi:fimbrial chaperone protein
MRALPCAWLQRPSLPTVLALMALLGAQLGGQPAWAGGLSILPTRLDFTAGRGVQSVLLTNTSAQTVSVETEVLARPDGAPGQQASDLVVTPAVVTLPPNQRVRLRVGLLRPSDPEREQAYRLYFTELPAPSPVLGAGIGVRLRVGIPVFVAPQTARPQPLRWTASEGQEGWQLELHNDGNVHARVSRAVLMVDGQAVPIEVNNPYLLARTRQTYPWPAAVKPGSRVRWLEGSDERESGVALP